MKNIFILVLLLNTQSIFAQLNISLSQNFNDFYSWNIFYRLNDFEGKRMFGQSYGLEAGYLFRMLDERVDIVPSIGYALARKEEYMFRQGFDGNHAYATFKLHQANINANIKFYPFDFKGKNQPTIIKHDKNVLKESFYVFATPSFSLYRPSYDMDAFESQEAIQRSFNLLAFRYGGGVGFDFGISESLTITPHIAFHRTPRLANDFLFIHSLDANPLSSRVFFEDRTTDVNQIQVGINITFENIKFKNL